MPIANFAASGHALVQMQDGSVYDIDQVNFTGEIRPDQYNDYLVLIPDVPSMLHKCEPYLHLQELAEDLLRSTLHELGPLCNLDMVTVVASPITVSVWVEEVVRRDLKSAGWLWRGGAGEGITLNWALNEWFKMTGVADGHDDTEQHEV